jgi:hypothetical protein
MRKAPNDLLRAKDRVVCGLRRYDSGMSGSTSGVTTAVIAGGFAVGGAVIGFCGSAWNTRASLRASRDAVREQRLWEQRSPLYRFLLSDIVAAQSNDSDVPNAVFASRIYEALLKHSVGMQAYASDALIETYNRTLVAARKVTGPPDRREVGLRDRRRQATQELNRQVVQLHADVRRELQTGEIHPSWRAKLKRRQQPRAASAIGGESE